MSELSYNNEGHNHGFEEFCRDTCPMYHPQPNAEDPCPPDLRSILLADALQAAKTAILGGLTDGVPGSWHEQMHQRVSKALLSLPEWLPNPTPRFEATAPATGPLGAQEAVLREALNLYAERAAERAEVWRRSGVKGQTFHLMAKAERAFLQVMSGDLPNRDHYIDMINYAAFAIRLIDDGEDMDEQDVLRGDWPWA